MIISAFTPSGRSRVKQAARSAGTRSAWSIPGMLSAPSCLYNSAPCSQRGCKSSPGPGQSRILQEMRSGSSCEHPEVPAVPIPAPAGASRDPRRAGSQGGQPGRDRGALSRGCSNPGAFLQLPCASFISSSLGAASLLLWDIISMNPPLPTLPGEVLLLEQRHSWNGAVFSCSCQAAQAAALTGWDVGEEPREHWKKTPRAKNRSSPL